MSKVLATIFLTVFFNATVFATAQMPDKIIYEGKT